MARVVAALVLAMVALAATLLPTPASANAPLIGKSAGSALPVCILTTRPGDDPAQLLRQPDRFDCTTPQTQFGPGDYWALSAPIGVPSLEANPLAARIASVWQRSLALHILYADGHIVHIADDNRGITRRIQLGAVVEYPIPSRDAKVARLLWKVEGAANLRGIVLSPRLVTQAGSDRSNLALAALYSAFAGLGIALLVYNLALWVSLRHRFQLAYSLMVATLLVYAFTSSGALAWAMPDIANNDRLRLNYLLLTLASSAALAFARTFFEEHVFGPRLRRLVQISIAALLVTGITITLFAPLDIRLFDRIFSSVFIGVIITVTAIIWSAWRTRSNYLWLFALAWAAPIIAASMRVFANFGLLRWSFWLDNSTILSMAAEALLSSIAIAYRIRLLSRERDQAVAAETVARRLAGTDPLTGLLNRRAFLDNAIGRAGAQTLLILDLDHFKQVNETLGHDGGDEVLRAVARAIRSLAPPGALVARLGGEEFAVVTGHSQSLDPNTLLARLRATRMPFDLRVTASIGTASGPLMTEPDWKSLYRAADHALFAAKAAGRDRARAAPLAA